MRFSGVGVARLVDALPPTLVAPPDDADWMRAAFGLIADESLNPRPGSDLVTARLADVLVVQAIRTWLESATPERGWVAGLRDPQLGRALAAFNRAFRREHGVTPGVFARLGDTFRDGLELATGG